MLLHSLNRVVAYVFLLALFASLCFAQAVTGEANAGVQMEFPAGGRLRIENQFGGVAVESWKEKFIDITTSEDTAASKGRSVVIENRDPRTVIRVMRRPGLPVAQIDLSIKLPETARVEIVTGSGRISLRGLPASAVIRSVSGDATVEFLDTANADIIARSIKGSVKSELPQLMSENGHVLQARLGNGTQTLRVNSDAGSISLLDESHNATSSRPARKELLDAAGQDTPKKAAGTPAPAEDVQEISEGDVIRVDSQLVTLNMSVIDRQTNRGVVGLAQTDFQLFENGTEQQILQFDSSSAPFDLLLVIDLSGSTREVLKLIRAAALRFVNAARPSDRIGVITFAREPTVVSPLTQDRRTLRQRISEMDTSAGDTKLYDATDFAVNQSLRDAKSARRTAIILMSDGLDGNIEGVQGDGSKLSYKDLLNRVAEFDGVIYTLWLNTEYEALSPFDTQPEAFDAGYDRMKEMADTGGGVFYEVKRLEDLAGAYERVVADLGTVYSLAYRPADKTRDGRWRAIQVKVVSRPSAIARGKRGYHAN
ncbi:MAG TPA: VWA domain-containing protein [Pyrinomonadaceae bacterium]|nr:VWA domain-containing protein [Pyrinomonadaceae bacterium]